MNDNPNTISFRLSSVEEHIKELQGKLNSYVTERENDLRLKNIADLLNRIVSDIEQVKESNKELNEKIIEQQNNFNSRFSFQQNAQSKTQIRILWGTVSTIIGLLTAVFAGYITHLFH
jgi:predicted house-cleaning noncanonical NTP pyrophosphatase (MazG superfamily)